MTTEEAMRVQFTQLANAAACLYGDTGSFEGKLGGAVESARALVKAELERSKPFLKVTNPKLLEGL